MQAANDELQQIKKNILEVISEATAFSDNGVSYYMNYISSFFSSYTNQLIELLSAINNAEKEIYSHVNRLLKKIRKTQPLDYQKNIFAEVKQNIEILKNITKVLTSENALSILLSNAPPAIKELSDKLLIIPLNSRLSDLKLYNRNATEEGVLKSNENSITFLKVMKNVMLLSLIRVCTQETGYDFIKKLNKQFAETHHHIELSITQVIDPGSLRMVPETNEAYAINIKTTATDLRDQAKSVQKQAGCNSTLILPVWLDNDNEKNEKFYNSIGVYFKTEEGIEAAINHLTRGSFSFDLNENIFYTPTHIEFLHELIHAYHNSKGVNRVNLPHKRDFVHLWHDFEEYWTITGAKFSENTLNAMFALPTRLGHKGFNLDMLDQHLADNQLAANPSSPLLRNTF